MRLENGWLLNLYDRFSAEVQDQLSRSMGIGEVAVDRRVLAEIDRDLASNDEPPHILATSLMLECARLRPVGELSLAFAIIAVNVLADRAGYVLRLDKAMEGEPAQQTLHIMDDGTVGPEHVEVGVCIGSPVQRPIVVVVGAARSNAAAEERKVAADHGDGIYEELTRRGYDVRTPNLYAEHERCDLELEADVFVALAASGSNREGIQATRLARLGAVVLPVSRRGVGVPCLFTDQREGHFLEPLWYDDPGEVALAVAERLEEVLPMLRERAVRRWELAVRWQPAVDLLAQALDTLPPLPADFPLTREQVEMAAWSPYVMAGLGAEQQARLEELIGQTLRAADGSALMDTDAEDLESLFTTEQRAALHEYLRIRRMGTEQRSRLLRHALARASRHMAGSTFGRPLLLTSAEDWDELERSLGDQSQP